MRRWQLQDAKNHFSDVVNRAHTEGPQIVTKRGVETAVVLSYDKYRELTGQKMTFEDFLLTAPRVDIELDRSDEPARDVEL
jgi:antitoxin Phd